PGPRAWGWFRHGTTVSSHATSETDVGKATWMSENTMLKVNEHGHLVVGGCDTVELAQKHGTPLYLYDEEAIRSRCREYITEFGSRYPNVEIAYASKAALTKGFARLMEQEGMALDVASAGELYTALQADFPSERIKM